MTDSPFRIRAALEGFYGTFYTHAQRNDLIRFLGNRPGNGLGFTHYIYGPKNDRYHRLRWRTPYPGADMREFARTVAVAREAGLVFVYALSPGGSITYSSAEDFELLRHKFRAFYEVGVRDFSLFLDDIVPQFHSAADEQVYGPATGARGPGIRYATAQADLCNRTYDWLQEVDPSCTLSMCPTDYAGTAPFSDYLHQLGAHLYPAIDIFYTGPLVCSTTIDTADAAAFGSAIQRPPLIWDNYPVNDLGMQYDMHIGPILGRGADLYKSVRGVAVNLMLQPEASKVALHTFATYFANPHDYDPQAAWLAALDDVASVASAESLYLFGENSLRSCLTGRDAEAKKMDRLAEDTLAGLLQGVAPGQSEPFAALEEYLIKIDDACYHLSYYMPNLSLRQDLLPWTESLKWRQEMGQYALRTLRALEKGQTKNGVIARLAQRLKEAIAEVEKRPYRIGGPALLPLAHYALEQAVDTTSDTAGSPVADPVTGLSEEVL